jgi:hypothetical protein
MMRAREPPQPMTDRRKYSTFLIGKTRRHVQTCLQLEIRSYNNNSNNKKVHTNHWFWQKPGT